MAGDPIERAALKLKELRRLDPGYETFGASAHRYRLAPPLDEARLSQLERDFELVLPEDYRRFVLELGDGGAGPDYGLVGVARVFEAGWVSKAQLAAAWPFEDTTDPYEDEDEDDEDEDGEPWRQGCLPLGDKGCGYENLLVVTGPRRGTVWFDFTAAEDGVRFSGQTFIEWYEAWLDRALGERREAKRARDETARYWQRILHTDQRNVDALYHLGELHWVLDKDPKRALDHLERAVRFDPGHPAASVLLCRLLRLQENFPEVERIAGRALDREDVGEHRAWLLGWRGVAREALGEPAVAAEMIDEALKLNKRVGRSAEGVRLPGARAHRALGHLDRARGLLRGAGQTPLIRYWLGRVELERGEAKAAVELLAGAARAAPRAAPGVGPVPEDVERHLADARRAAGEAP